MPTGDGSANVSGDEVFAGQINRCGELETEGPGVVLHERFVVVPEKHRGTGELQADGRTLGQCSQAGDGVHGLSLVGLSRFVAATGFSIFDVKAYE